MKNKIIILLICTIQLLLLSKTYSQTLDSFLKVGLPKNLTFSIKKDSSYIKEFNKSRYAIIDFVFKKTSVRYFVFTYSSSDSLNFINGNSKYLMQSNCAFTRNKEKYKNLQSFIKGDYYFLLELCPCKTNGNVDCGKLALKLNKWIKKSN
jgi:hypothetical protein